MKLALVGKGGVGKTSISGTLARLLARRGLNVLAIDGDPNPNLALTLGVEPERMEAMPALTKDLLEWLEDGSVRLTQSFEQICADRSIPAPDGVTLLALRPETKAGIGWLGTLHATVRSLVEIASADPQDVCLLDIEASLEHFSQSKALHAERILIVVEPYLRSLETGRRMIGLARQLFPERIELVINKVHDERELESAEELSSSTGVEIAAVIPYDERLIAGERAGLAPLDFDPEGAAVLAVAELADHLLASTVLQHDPR